MEDPADLSLAEFLNHPSFRQIATFFLGFVFISCLHFTFPVIVAVTRRICSPFRWSRRRAVGGVGLEANRPPGDDKVHSWLGHGHVDRPRSVSSNSQFDYLAISLTICFAMASIAEFGALLVFDSNNGQAPCAFLVAWGGMASQAARLLGLLKLSLDLRQMGIYKWETLIFWGWLVCALVAMFVSNAISIGTIKQIPQMPGSALCFRKHFLPTAVVSSAVNTLLEVYCLIRINYLLVPAFLSVEHKLDAVLDVRISRALSLLILDATSVVPAAKFFSVLTDVIPSSVGTLLVLIAFNQRSPDLSLGTTASIPATRPESVHSRSTIEIKKMPSAHSLSDRDRRVSTHPFAASALQDPSLETEDWPAVVAPDIQEKSYFSSSESAGPTPGGRRQTWRSSNPSTASETDSDISRSNKGATVSFAFRDQGRKARQQRRSFLPAMPSMSEIRRELARPTLPRSTPFRVPKPVAPAAVSVEVLERASSEPPHASPRESTTSSRPRTSSEPSKLPSAYTSPHISITSASPAIPPIPTTSSSSGRPSFAISVPSHYEDSTKSIHLTPTTPAPSQPSHRGSSSSGLTDWRFDSQPDSLQGSPEEASPMQARRQSGGSSRLPPADDDLSVVYEASHEDSESIPPSRVYRATFGEHMFVQGGLGRQVSPPSDVPQDVRTEESSDSTKSKSSGTRD